MSHFSCLFLVFFFFSLVYYFTGIALWVSLHILLAADRSWPCVLTLTRKPGLCPSLVPAPSNALLRIAYLHNHLICKTSFYISSFPKCNLALLFLSWLSVQDEVDVVTVNICFTPCLRTAFSLSSLKMLTVGFHGWASHHIKEVDLYS